jgi:DnaD/phage-associated family protein
MTLHPQLREALARIRAAGEANWHVLTAYILHANGRGRAWPSLDTLSRETGYGRPAVIAARKWLVRAGALSKVSYALRIGDERTNPRKEVMQITGVIAIDDRVLRVLAPDITSAASPAAGALLTLSEGQPGIPIEGRNAAGITPEGHAPIPEDAATPASDSAGSPATGFAALSGGPGMGAASVAQGVGQVWQQEARQPLTPILGEILAELVERHGAEQVVEAVREAVGAVGPGKFSVKYVIRILERWAREGKGEASPEKRARRPPRSGRRKPSQPVDFSEGRTLV